MSSFATDINDYNNMHTLLVKVRNSIATGTWRPGWNGCIYRHLAVVIGIGDWTPIKPHENMIEMRRRGNREDPRRVVGMRVALLFAQALDFTGVRQIMTWNDAAANKEVILARLDKAIIETAPPPEDVLADVTLASEARELVPA